MFRLMNELRGWVLGHEEELRRQREVDMIQQASRRPTKKYYTPRKLKAAMRGNNGNSKDSYPPGYHNLFLVFEDVTKFEFKLQTPVAD